MNTFSLILSCPFVRGIEPAENGWFMVWSSLLDIRNDCYCIAVKQEGSTFSISDDGEILRSYKEMLESSDTIKNAIDSCLHNTKIEFIPEDNDYQITATADTLREGILSMLAFMAYIKNNF